VGSYSFLTLSSSVTKLVRKLETTEQKIAARIQVIQVHTESKRKLELNLSLTEEKLALWDFLHS
jgi:hypothetical protein